ncbi:outer membrane protein assembly complex, YaeT protein, partial [gut metagenome]
MCKKIVLFFICLGVACGASAQGKDTTKVEKPAEVPVISYSLAAKKYKIADIQVTGIKNYDDFVLIGFSGLSVGDEITVPGEEITTAVKRFWKHGLFSDVKILATKIEGDKIWLEIQLKQRPRISEVHYNGIKKSEREDLEAKLGLKKGFQVTPNVMDRAKTVIQRFFDGKGFKNVNVDIVQKDDPANEGEVIVNINIDKNEKTKIHRIYFDGNEKLTSRELKKAMKKTNEKFSIPNDWKTSIREMFSTKKFTTEEYENDK